MSVLWGDCATTGYARLHRGGNFAFAIALPDNRGLASSMLSFIQMMLFALVSGLLAPMLFDSALKLALGVLGGLVGSFICWRMSLSWQAQEPVAQL